MISSWTRWRYFSSATLVDTLELLFLDFLVIFLLDSPAPFMSQPYALLRLWAEPKSPARGRVGDFEAELHSLEFFLETLSMDSLALLFLDVVALFLELLLMHSPLLFFMASLLVSYGNCSWCSWC